MLQTILYFCADCGSLLRTEEFECENCGNNTSDRSDRIEGAFSEDEAAKLFKVNCKD